MTNVVVLEARREPIHFHLHVVYHHARRLEIDYESSVHSTVQAKETYLDAMRKALTYIESELADQREREANVGKPSDT